MQRARRIVAEVDEMKQAARRSRDPEAGSLRLGVFPTVGPYPVSYTHLDVYKRQYVARLAT